MKIITYDKLKKRDDIFMLWLKSFGWAGAPAWLSNFARYDTRIGESPVGMCGIINDKIVGIVGIMTIPTRTKLGKTEEIGGIYGIATRPSYNRRGVGRQLLEASERYFKDRGMKFSFLTTERPIVAYKWYLKAGYSDVTTVDNYPFMYKVFSRPNPKPEKSTSREYRFDLKKAREIFDWYAKSHCGFTIRSAKLFKSHDMAGSFTKKISVMVDNGYALLQNNCDSILIKEIVAKTQKTYRALIRLAEKRAKYAVAAIHPFDPKARKALAAAGYQNDKGNYGTLMCKPLGKSRFSDYYDKNFMISKVDWF
ncbi:MAG: GNAT family N-acetyltransferase [candidate division Zixibacteria bacterium]|nr:GNAT family N-acetyltransferase [candidate division Zixibacteria bacterium]